MPSVTKPRRTRVKHYFREWREKKFPNQEQAMAVLGWSQSKISRLENGVTPFNEDDLLVAAEAYGIQPFQLLLDPDAQEEPIRGMQAVEAFLRRIEGLRPSDLMIVSGVIGNALRVNSTLS